MFREHFLSFSSVFYGHYLFYLKKYHEICTPKKLSHRLNNDEKQAITFSATFVATYRCAGDYVSYNHPPFR
jgi:hypothetical protein